MKVIILNMYLPYNVNNLKKLDKLVKGTRVRAIHIGPNHPLTRVAGLSGPNRWTYYKKIKINYIPKWK